MRNIIVGTGGITDDDGQQNKQTLAKMLWVQQKNRWIKNATWIIGHQAQKPHAISMHLRSTKPKIITVYYIKQLEIVRTWNYFLSVAELRFSSPCENVYLAVGMRTNEVSSHTSS